MTDEKESPTQPMALLKKLRLTAASVREHASLDEETGCYLVPAETMQALFEVTHPKTEKCPYCDSDAQTTGHSYNCKCSRSNCKMFSYWMPIEFWNAGAASMAKDQ